MLCLQIIYIHFEDLYTKVKDKKKTTLVWRWFRKLTF